MAQLYYKTVTISQTSGVTDYPCRLVVGESEYSHSFCQPWTTQPYATTNQTTVNSTGGILAITSTAPSGTEDFVVRKVGVQRTENEIKVHISPDYVTLKAPEA